MNLDDTGRCPVAEGCATCGRGGALSVATVETPVGVFCLTLCESCVGDGQRLPVLSWPRAVELCGAHCTHLGIDVDEMTRLIDADKHDPGQPRHRW